MPRSPVTHSLSFPPPSPLPHSTTQPIVLLFTHLGCFFVSMIPALDLLSQATVPITLNHNFCTLRLFLCNSAICILVEKAHLLTPKIENLNCRDAPSSLPPTCFVVVILKVACPIVIGSANGGNHLERCVATGPPRIFKRMKVTFCGMSPKTVSI